jgi:putative transcriptional regulator
MNGKVAQSVRRGLRQALAYARREARQADYRGHVPAEFDVRAIREKLGLTQAQFAARFAFSINTLRHWEQGKRQPEGPTRAYLQVIARTPRAVERALRAASNPYRPKR